MAELTVLTMTEKVQIDSRRLAEIVDELGETAAHDVLTLALEQLARGLQDLRAAAAQGDAAALAMRAEMLARLAWQLGMTSLAGVAVDVAVCAERRDDIGLAATLGRLLRIGNRSLTEIWDEDPGPG
ncbi:hypothetical protein SAMN05444389_104161 [Paracoccus solventivorans]|uniref:Hpt domain-containing protein n=1 Tax=Paracoccus solventivorans TaxID=53463 RepID=A0A1M7GIM0_9RHOB|nr:hypothetical protein [Paracoccus solventivorans]SHM16252.1 hypothetical protein SAMN05444389_104161 [Paracoccus solventivorans]